MLLTTALKSSNRAWLRQVLGSPPRKKRAAEGSAEQVAGQLSEAEQLQMLLLLRDDELVALIDDCVYNNDIVIPLSEMRSAQVRFSKLNRWDSFVEASSFGLRAQRRYPLVTLMLSIWETYDSQGLMEELSWKLGKPVEGLSRDVLMKYIQERGPVEVVRELVLSIRPVALSIANEVNLAIVPNEAREQLVNRFLWKFGFNPSRHNDKYPRLRARLTQFKDTLLRTNVIRTEDDREEIRSQGVNLFVSVEVFLEDLISYVVWLLSSDHYIDTRNRFRYDSGSALASVGRTLGPQASSGEHQSAWSNTGNNTLGDLLVYLSQARRWMQSLLESEAAEYKRDEKYLPAFVEDAEQIFPFTHTELWADCDRGELTKFVEGFGTIADRLLKADLATVRNGLDHKRSDSTFPLVEKMSTCVNSLQYALDYADANRYLPKIFWLVSRETDRFGRQKSVLCDYRDHDLLIREPTTVYGRPPLNTKEPILVAPGNLIGLPNSQLIFRVIESSQYSNYWDDYPRRRKTLDPVQDLSAAARQVSSDAEELV